MLIGRVVAHILRLLYGTIRRLDREWPPTFVFGVKTAVLSRQGMTLNLHLWYSGSVLTRYDQHILSVVQRRCIDRIWPTTFVPVVKEVCLYRVWSLTIICGKEVRSGQCKTLNLGVRSKEVLTWSVISSTTVAFEFYTAVLSRWGMTYTSFICGNGILSNRVWSATFICCPRVLYTGAVQGFCTGVLYRGADPIYFAVVRVWCLE